VAGELTMAEDRPINTNPDVIGYWARVRGLTWENILQSQVAELVGVLLSGDNPAAFHAGWQQADEELRNEQIQKLLADLREAYEGPP
jgi:hypothetical protein